MPLIQLTKTTEQTAKPVDSSACVKPGGKPNLEDVLRRLERDVRRASAKPQVKMVKRHEAAAMLGVSTRTLQRWHKQSYGPRRSIGKRFHYVKFEIEEWIANHGRGGKRSDPSERSPESTNLNPGDEAMAINCTKVDTPMAFITIAQKWTRRSDGQEVEIEGLT
jgi:hypothetical protein